MKTAVVGMGVPAMAVLDRYIWFLKMSELSTCLKKLYTVFFRILFIDINIHI